MLRKAQDQTSTIQCKLVTCVSTRFASVLAMFKSCLQNREAIHHLFSNLAPGNMRDRVPSKMTWEIVQIAYLTMKDVMESILVQQASAARCLFSSGVANVIELYLKMLMPLKETKAGKHLYQLAEEWDNSDLAQLQKLQDMAIGLRQSVKATIKSCLHPYMEYDESSSHFWVALMLDPRFKRLQLLRKLENVDNDFKIAHLVVQYEDQSLFPALKNCFMHMHDNETNQALDEEEDDPDDFAHYKAEAQAGDRITSTVKEEFRRFRKTKDLAFHEDPMTWFATLKDSFPTVSLLARQIFSIPHSQISVERLFSISGHLTANRRNRMDINNVNSIITINKTFIDPDPRQSIDDFISQEIDLLQNCEEEELVDIEDKSD